MKRKIAQQPSTEEMWYKPFQRGERKFPLIYEDEMEFLTDFQEFELFYTNNRNMYFLTEKFYDFFYERDEGRSEEHTSEL